MNPNKMQVEPGLIKEPIQKLNHQTIAKSFINNFSNGLNFGIGFVDSFFDPNSLCSLYIHLNQSVDITETVGYANLRNKLLTLGIKTFKYDKFVQTSQPMQETNLIVTVIGKASINDKSYNFESVFILKKNFTTYLVANYILQIFI